MSATVVGKGWHDVCVRWDISTPQAVVERLRKLPGGETLSQPGTKVFGERGRFGKWEHVLGEQNALLVYVVDSPTHGLIRRLEVQAHLGDAGEDDLCEPAEFERRWKRLTTFMAMLGVLPPEEPVYVRVDPAVDVVYERPDNGRDVLEGLRYARWPRGWYAEYQGSPPYTTVAVKHATKTVARAYCRNTKLRNGRPRWGKLRFEREQRFSWRDQRPLQELESREAAGMFWSSAFGSNTTSGRVTRLRRESQTRLLVERVESGEIQTRQFEQLAGFLDAERLGLTSRVYNTETARRRRGLARQLGLASSDSGPDTLDVSLEELLAAPRSAWDG